MEVGGLRKNWLVVTLPLAELKVNSIAQNTVVIYLTELVMFGQIAQSVEQRTENPCVAGSIPVLAIFFTKNG